MSQKVRERERERERRKSKEAMDRAQGDAKPTTKKASLICRNVTNNIIIEHG